MGPLVSLEMTYMAKGLFTLRTLIRLFSSMDPLVYLESRHVAKDLPTL